MKPVLLLVDLQNDFLDARGLEPPASEIVRRAARLLAGARAANVTVAHVWTTVDPAADDRMPHWKTAGRRACVAGTAGHRPPPELAAEPGEAVFAKRFFSAFETPALSSFLARVGADSLWLAGVHLHGCVRATALDAYARGIDVRIASDAVGSDDPLHAAVTRRYLEGRAARFASAEELLASVRGEHPKSAPPEERLPAAVVGGRAIAGDGRFFREHRCPSDVARVLFAVSVAGPEEARAAAREAAAAGQAWRAEDGKTRARRLACVAERLEREADALAELMARDVGKPVALAHAEAVRAAAVVRHAAEGATRQERGLRFRRVPLGAVALVTPWNNPVAIPAGKIAAALAFGNAVVWKPAPAGTGVALRLLALLRESGIPEGLVGLVAGDDRTSRAVMSDEGIDAVSLSGSSAAGWAAQEICARRRIPLQAELGGNNAAIVWRDADLAASAREIARGAFVFAGQRCTANRRAVVDAAIFEDFVERVAAETAALVWGDPSDARTDVGPLVDAESRDRVAAVSSRAESVAERMLVPHDGDRAASLERGAYYPPTLAIGVPPRSEAVQEETFGPLLVVQRAPGFDEALELAGSVRQGLVAALFARDPALHERFLAAARAGVLRANASTADAAPDAPFGGWKASGIGPPERGPGDLEFYTRLQTVEGLG